MADITPQPPSFPEEPGRSNPSFEDSATPIDGQNPPAARRKRRWPWVVGGIVLLLILLVVLAPTLLSTGPARSMVLGVVNDSLNGKVEVSDWSLGWNSGITVNGLKVYEDKDGKNLILQASRARTELSLLKAMRSGFTDIALGRTDVDDLDLVNLYVDEQGTPNIVKIAKPSKPKEKKSEPIHLSGDIHVNNMTGVVTAAGIPQRLRIDPSNLSVALTGLNDPIANDVKLAFTVEDARSASPTSSTPGTITLTGKADLFDNDKVNLDTATVEEKLSLANVNVAALNPFLAIAKLDLALVGIASGGLDVNLKGTANTAAKGEIKIANFQATGPALKGDTFRSNLTVPVKVTRTVGADNVTLLKVDDLRIQTDYGYVGVTANVSQESLQRIAKKLPPGREGQLTVTANFEQAAKLIEGLRNTLQLQPDVKLDSAKVFAQVDAWLYPDRVVNKTRFNLADVAATNKAGKVTLQPISTSLDVTYAAVENQPFTINQLRDVGIAVDSAFAKLNGATEKGGTLAKFKLTGDGDLGKLQQQLAQFADLGKLQAQGTWKLLVNTNGDPSVENATINTNLEFTGQNVVVAGLAAYPPLRQPWLHMTGVGNLRLKASKPDAITDAAVVLKSNNPENPTVDLVAKGDVDLNTFASTRFDVSVKALLDKVRDEFGPMAPALAQLESGRLAASVGGSYDGKNLTLLADKPLAVKFTNLSVRQSADAKAPVVIRDQSLDATLAGVIGTAGEQIGADVQTLAITAPKLLELKKNDGPLKVIVTQANQSKKVTGNGGINIAYADLKRFNDIAKSFSAPPAPTSPDANIGQLTRALLTGTLTFQRGAEPTTTIAGNFTADVGVTTAKEPINDKIAITLNASAPDDLSQQLKAALTVKSNTLNAAVTDAVVVLARQLADKSTAFNGPFDLLRSAKINVTAERLELVQAMLDSFSPPAAGPVAPPAAAPAAAPAPTPSRLTGEERITGDERISRRAPEPDIGAAAANAAAASDLPLTPLRVLSGRLALNANVSRENQTTTLKDTTLNVSNLSFRRGDGFYESKGRPVNLKLSAAVETAEAANADGIKTAQPASAAIKRIQVQELAGDVAVGQLKLAKPIVVTNLAAAIPTVDGAIQVNGSLADALRLLEAYQGEKAGTKYPYTGDYDVTQNVSTEGDTVRLVGTIKATKFKAFDATNPSQPTFAEDLLSVTNDLSADTKTDTATIRNLAMSMQSTGALAIAVSNGQLVDWANERKIAKEIQAKVRIDWPKLWTVVRPMLDPETRESLKDLQLAGVMDRTFTVTGSFPATGADRRGDKIPLTAVQALRFLNAYGGISFERVSVNGIDVRDLDLPVSLEKGVAYIQDATKPKGQRYPQPFACNGGTIDLGGVQVDLRHVGSDGALVPWFTIPDANKVVLKNVALNPLLADSTLGNYINPGFSGPKDARGRVTLTSVECRDVPLDWFTAAKRQTTPGGPESGQAPARRVRQQTRSDGRAEFLLAITEMELQAPLLPFLLRTDQLSGEVRKGHIVIENGIVKSDIPIVDQKGNALMAWNGSVSLQDRRILNFTTGIAKELLADLPILRNNAKLLPAVVNVPISGPFDKPRIDLAGAVTKSLLPGIGSGRPEDLIDQLPGLFGGNKKDKNKPQGDEPINRNSRDRDRRSSADDPRDAAGDGNARSPSRPEDPVGGLLDLAGGLLNANNPKRSSSDSNAGGGTRDNRDARDSRGGRDPRSDRGDMGRSVGEDRVSGSDRITGGPRTNDGDDARTAGDRRPSGDDRISTSRPTTAPATTAPTAPRERNVSGRTRAARNRDAADR